MLKKVLSGLALSGAIALLPTAAVAAYQIDYETGYSANWQEISPSFGSIAGLVTVSYSDASRGVDNFRFWAADYSGSAAAFAGNGDSVGAGSITFTPAAGYAITLNSFFLGSYLNAQRSTSYSVDNLATPGVDLASGVVSVGANGLTVLPNLTSSKGIALSFGPSAYNVGIDHINFSVTAVPEPETYGMLLAGMAVIAAMARRRKLR